MKSEIENEKIAEITLEKKEHAKEQSKKHFFSVFSSRRPINREIYWKKKTKSITHAIISVGQRATFVIENGVINDRTINEGLVRVLFFRF